MTIKTEINGLPFEIELADGLNVEFSEGGIRVSKHFTLAQQLLGQQLSPMLVNQNPQSGGLVDHYAAWHVSAKL